MQIHLTEQSGIESEQHTRYLVLLGTVKAYLSIRSVKDRGRLPPGLLGVKGIFL